MREWLNSQAAGGYVLYHPASATYELTPEQAMVLANENSPVFLPLAWEVPVSMWIDQEKTLKAFRTGQGIGWDQHDERLFSGSAAFYKNAYGSSLVSEWLPTLEGVVDKLESGARVADVGCGHGHSTIIMAEAFPKSRFWGFEYHQSSVDAAPSNAKKSGASERVTFSVATAKSYPTAAYDLICFFDCLHDMGDPVGAAEYARQALASDGTILLVEPFAANRVEDNFNPVGRLYYAASATICCAHSLSEEVGTALGAQAGEERLACVFRSAGFRKFRRAMATPFNLILEARP